jgi:hypothetical protein
MCLSLESIERNTFAWETKSKRMAETKAEGDGRGGRLCPKKSNFNCFDNENMILD